MVRVSVVTLTWNNLEYTKKAVESIKKILTPDDEVIFVDNLSNDGTALYLDLLELPCATTVNILPFQCGIGHAYNKAFSQCSGEYIFIYDNDLEIVMPNTLEHLIKVHEERQDAGIVCPCCSNVMGRYRCCLDIQYLEHDIVEISKKWNCAWPECPSAAWLIKKKCLAEIGGWDEQFDPYGIADYDYALRVVNAGWKILVDRHIFVKHYGGVTSSKYVNGEMLEKTRQLFFKKWYPNEQYPKGGAPRIRNR